jgi:hypothetical protein
MHQMQVDVEDRRAARFLLHDMVFPDFIDNGFRLTHKFLS